MRTLVAECKIPTAPSRYEEVETMAESIGYEVIDTVVQHRKNLHHTYCVGPGKLEEIKMLVVENDIEAVVFANTLPSAQVFKIQRVLGGTDIKVIDRNLLILARAAQPHRVRGRQQCAVHRQAVRSRAA